MGIGNSNVRTSTKTNIYTENGQTVKEVIITEDCEGLKTMADSYAYATVGLSLIVVVLIIALAKYKV
jgi:hypothetical protein